MTIAAFPAVLQPIIQTGYLEQRFREGLRSVLRYRLVADREPFAAGIGETLTKTRTGLLASAITPLSNANIPDTTTQTTLDNGITTQQWSVEQYTIGINQYGSSLNLNTVTARVAIADRFATNAAALGEQAARSLDDLARNALFGSYLAGNTRVRVTLGAPATTISVDDIRGFQTTWVNGVPTTVSNTNYIAVTVGSNVYNIGTATADGTNVSTLAAIGGISGTLTTVAGNITVADGTALNAVTAPTAPVIIRPSGRATSAALLASDVLTMSNLLDAKAKLEVNAVPKIDGFYHCYLDPVSARQLFADSDFKLLFQGATAENVDFRSGEVRSPFLGLRFLPTTEAYVQTHPSIAGAVIRRPIIAGAGALIEGDYEGQDGRDTATPGSIISQEDGVTMVTRAPLDRLQQNIAQSWYWVGGFAVPTDTTVNSTTVATATNAAYKRAVAIEHIG